MNQTILIVDDDSSYLQILREWLKDHYKLFMSNSGMRGIKWLEKNKADLILLDYMMPEKSGPEILELIRKNPATSEIPVFFLTGKEEKESIDKVLSLKPEGCILKSSGRKEIVGTIDKFFGE